MFSYMVKSIRKIEFYSKDKVNIRYTVSHMAKKKKCKKKKFKKIPKEKIINSTIWKPPDKKMKIIRDTNSWFNLDQMNYDNNNGKDKCKVKLVQTKTLLTRPIRIIPTTSIQQLTKNISKEIDQKSILLQWIEVYRRVYNLTVAYMKKEVIMSLPKLRPIIDKIISETPYLNELSKSCGILKHTRDNAINDCILAYKTAFANLKARNIKHFKIRYKKKSHHLSSIVIEPSAFCKPENKNGFAFNILGNIESSELLKGITKECRLCYNSRSNVFLLRVPFDNYTNQIVKCGNVASLDPGIRTFQTVYSPQGNCYDICSNASTKKLKQLTKKLNEKNSKNRDEVSNFREYKPKKYLMRIQNKIKNMIKDMHCKVSNFLCRTFDVILIGNMSTKSIISKKGNMSASNKKLCLTLSHYKFKLIIENMAKRFDTKVHYVDESYTTKTCSWCGYIKNDVGTNKRFNCNKCLNKCDRDLNAARNIYIKNTL